MKLSHLDNNPLAAFEVDTDKLLLTERGAVPLIHWPVNPNFGDDLSPWLFEKLIGMEIQQNIGKIASYIAVGSIIKRVRNQSIVWGTGSFGNEKPYMFNRNAEYLAVRGPLTRSRLIDRDIECPRIYGDPALLTPMVYYPAIEKKYEIGLVLRWSETEWLGKSVGPGVKLIDLGTRNVEDVLDQILSCKYIITSSLHGLIIADAYGIPNAWLSSNSPAGFEFKFYDYFLSVDKVRHATEFEITENDASVDVLEEAFEFDSRKIQFDASALLDACPFLKRKPA